MKNPDKIRVAVLFGGRSAEHEISLLSAINVIENLDADLFEVVPIGIDKQGNWFLGNEVFSKSLEHKKVPLLDENNVHATWFTPEWVGKPAEKNRNDFYLQEVMARKSGALFDVVFPVMHGTFCEDGSLQGLLELANLPYVGAGVLGSAICMDKDVSKRLAKAAGAKVAPYVAIRKDEWLLQRENVIEQIEKKLNIYPVFVKPANTGSSIGISKVKNKNELALKINEAFRFDRKVLIEQAINARELEIAALESLEKNGEPIVSVVGEIKTNHEFYSYEAKYLDENGAMLQIPAQIDEALKDEARLIATTLFKQLECEGMARVDLFLDKDSKDIYFNEINTIPGFTQMSMYPKLMNASGISYPNLLKHLIELAMKKHKNKSELVHNYEE